MADNQLTQAVEKLNHALVKLQEIQNTLRGQGSSDNLIEDDTKSPKLISRLSRLNQKENDSAHGSEDWRRWSTPAPLMHQVASELVAASKLAKKTNDMMKAQRIHPQKDSTFKEHVEITLLHPTTKPNSLVNKPSKVKKLDKLPKENNICKDAHTKMRRRRSTLPSFQAAEGYINNLKFSEENEPVLHVLKLEGEEWCMKKKNKFGKKNAAAMLINVRIPEKRSTDVKLRELMKAEDAKDRQWHYMNIVDDPMYMEMQDPPSRMHPRRASCINLNGLSTNQSLKKSLDPDTQQDDGFDTESPGIMIANERFPVQVEEVRASRRKSWGFTSSDRAVVMFPNPAFDQTSREQNDHINRAQLDERNKTKRTKDEERNRINVDQPNRSKDDQRNRSKHDKKHPVKFHDGNQAFVDQQNRVKDHQTRKAHIAEQNRAQILCSKTQRENKLHDGGEVCISAKKTQDIVTLLPTTDKDIFKKKEKLVRLAPCPSIKPREGNLRYENLRTEARPVHPISSNNENVRKSANLLGVSDFAVKPKEKSFSLLPNNILPWKQTSKS